MICAKCQLENTTLQWHETATGFVCLGCYTNRRDEQSRLDKRFDKLKIDIKPKIKTLGIITKVIID